MEFTGTYVQVIPYIYSVDAEGNEITSSRITIAPPRSWLQTFSVRLSVAVPRHAGDGFWLQLVNMAVAQEQQSGRQVFMDFNRILKRCRVTCRSH